MNKTLTINIGGIVFNIEIDAFERLDSYLKDIKRHFTDSQGRDEIMADIESRIAEMFQEKVGKTKSVLILEDVERIIRIMGNPEEFGDSTSVSDSQSQQNNYSKQEYMGYRRRRVYRDADDRVIGGVCSGIANYFNMDPLWLRLALGSSFFFFGSGFLLYLILWIAIPEAKTTAEKLEMRGEPINIDNIKKSFNDEFEKINVNSKQFGNRAKHFGNDAADFITNVASGILKFAAKAIGIFFIFFGVITLAVVMASLFTDYSTIHINQNDDIHSYNFHEVLLMFFNNSYEISLATLGIFLMIGIPLLMIIYKGVRMIFKIKERNRMVSITASILFLIGISISTYVIFDIGQDFQTPAKQIQKVTLQTPSRDILYVQTDLKHKYDLDEEDADEDNNVDIKIGSSHTKIARVNHDGFSFSSPEFDVVPSKTDSFELVLIRTARGTSKKIAYERAGNFTYQFSQSDSILNLSNFFELTKNEKWRAQDLKIVLRVPVGKQVYLSKSLRNIIYDIDNVTNTHDSKMMNRRWIMNPEGLTCIDCDGINSRNKRHLSDEEEEETDF